MKRIIEHEESLNVVRQKCDTRQTDFTAEELRHLNLVNIELQQSYGKKFVKPLDQSCGYCVITAMNCVHNYIKFEESKDAGKNKSKHIEQVKEDHKPKVIEEWGTGNTYHENGALNITEIQELAEETHPKTDEDLTGLSLKDLRAKFPNIKARSIDRFIELLKEQ